MVISFLRRLFGKRANGAAARRGVAGDYQEIVVVQDLKLISISLVENPPDPNCVIEDLKAVKPIGYGIKFEVVRPKDYE